MSHLCNLAKVASGRGARSIWLAGISRPWFLAQTPRTMFTTSRRSSVEPNQRYQDQGEKFEPPRFEQLPDGNRRLPTGMFRYTMGTIAICLMGYSVYKMYGLRSMWPKDIRDDLRNGIKYRNRHNLPLSIQHLQQAWEMAKSLPLDSFGTDPLLKTSGIAIALADVLEDHGKKEEAYKVYQEALRQIQTTYLNLPPGAPQPDLGGMESLKLLTRPERMRAAALAHKLGGIASELKKPEKEEEKWLVWSVNAIIMAVMEVPAGSEKVGPPTKGLRVMETYMHLPSWARDHNIAAPFEALGTFYSDRELFSYALPLYLQAVSILIPTPPLKSSPLDRCRGAGVMRSISLLAIRGASFAEATEWAQKGMEIVNDARQSSKGMIECDVAYLLLLYQLGFIHSASGDNDKARETLETLVKDSKAMRYEYIAENGQRALDELDNLKVDNLKVESEIRHADEDKTV